MASIDSATNKTISPVPTQPSEATEATSTDKTQQLESLGSREGNVGDPPPSRLSIKSWISNLFRGGLPSLKPQTATEPKTVTVDLARAKLAEIKDFYAFQIKTANNPIAPGTENKLAKVVTNFQRQAGAIEHTIAEHTSQEGEKPFSKEETQGLVRDFKELHKGFGDAPATIFAKQKTEASKTKKQVDPATQLSERKVRVDNKSKRTPRFARLKTAFQSFKDFFKGLRPSERNAAKSKSPVNQKPTTEQVQHKQIPQEIKPLQQVGVARTAIRDNTDGMLALGQRKIEALETELEELEELGEKATEGDNPSAIATIKMKLPHYKNALADAQKVFWSMRDEGGATLSNAEVEAFNNRVDEFGGKIEANLSVFKVNAGADT